ncbi:glycoside hydrolase family 38 C-terminal domain-containing protein [Curtobacterium sp. MCLR17_036]|uniref:glycoside hydrolase family 38 N-terminal domain-containing protein n=1 Tax=Curtobacterium sp. MCLR17_036 TaxID=2175620 RepID=UPI000DA89C3E|nr:glycoside hydrolase family 38 C-terminal domain-containing protein [Curtobacterium sp. MCLR17_036]WIE64348.1 glycoside hydrolase family 38 C-terminal domain-containing protein [Curtobacterium sp. MCLR17_036]
MTDTALVSAQPWSHLEARAGLLDRATVAAATVGGTRVRVIPEPLLTERDGVPVQSVRVLLGEDGETETHTDTDTDTDTEPKAIGATLTGPGGDRVVAHAPSPDAGSFRLLVRTVDAPTEVTLALPGLGDETVSFVLLPQRAWSVHVVHHSHFDFGYTDPQTTVISSQRSYLDSAVELAHATEDWPDAARFRWNVEALWAFADWERHRPAAKVAEFVELVRQGSIGLSAMPYNLHTDTCSTEELHELFREARRIRDRYGIDFTTAMQTDVPGQVAGLPDALHDVGVRYLAVAHNWAGRSMPHQNGALDLPRMFRWRTPAGNSVVVWMTDSPHGLAYMEGPMVGLTESYEVAEAYLPAYLTALATRGYPFPPGVFGAHGEQAEGRPGYPWDVLHLRTQGFMGDNGPARLHLSEVVRRWNETWTSPTLRVSTNEDFFAEAEARHGDDLVTVEGDWGDWWVEGVGSAAVPLALAREAQATVSDARSFSQAAAWLGGQAVPTEHADAGSAWDAISMFNEHTWGASNSWTHGDEGYDSGERQWQWKVGQAITAHQRGRDLEEHALVYLADTVAAPDDALAAIVVANASGATRTGAVRFLLKESTVPLDAPVALRDGRTGDALPVVVEPQSNALHRESGRWVSVQLTDVPAFGFVRVDVLPGTAEPEPPRVHDPLTTPAAELFTLENAYLRVAVDPRTSTIRSVVERATGREIVEQDAPAGFNGYVYDEYGSSGAGVNHLANKLWSSDRLELLASRTVGGPAVLVERVSDAVEERLVYRFAAAGVDAVTVTLRLRHGEPRLRIANRLEKPVTRTKESAFFAFPFAAAEPVVRYEVSGGVTGDGLAHVPGAPQHMRAIRNWVSVQDRDDAVVWVTKDAPLVHPGTISLPYAPFPASTTPARAATVYSWLHNNVWDTNFPIEQGFTATFEYALGVRAEAGQSVEAVALQTTADLVRPMATVPAAGSGSGADASAELLTLDDDRVRLVSVVAGPDDRQSIVRLQSVSDQPVTLTLGVGTAVRAAARSTYLGDDAPGSVEVLDDGVRLALRPFEATAVRLTRLPQD